MLRSQFAAFMLKMQAYQKYPFYIPCRVTTHLCVSSQRWQSGIKIIMYLQYRLLVPP